MPTGAAWRGPRTPTWPSTLPRPAVGPAPDHADPAELGEAGQADVLGDRRPNSRPCSLRDSGIIASPGRSACRAGADRRAASGRPRAGPRESRRVRLARYSARASSVRPAPTRPARPTISPARTLERDVLHAWCAEAGDRERHRCLRRDRRRAGNVAPRDRPSIAFSSDRSVCPAAGAVRTTGRRAEWSPCRRAQHLAEEVRDQDDCRAAARESRMTSCSRSTSGRTAPPSARPSRSAASRHSARRISTFCWSAVRSPPAPAGRR